jgi:SagB-type dehydrogenase family enzyme
VTEPLGAPRQTARWLELVYGGPPDPFDPAESYHEASKVSPTQIGRQVAGAARLEATPDLQLSMTRAVRRLPVPRRALPTPRRPEGPLWQVIAKRRSCRRFSDAPVSGHDLAGLLESAYGVTHALEEHTLPLRAVPSGGALYPLELYVAALRVEGLEPGLYHFDPLAPALAVVHDSLGADDVSPLSTYPDIVAGSAAVLFVAAVFGRTRFKYGVRGYRFALLEAGHVAQNVLLTATAFGLGAVPLGGYYDRLTDEFLGLDGVNESTLYTVAVGSLPDG